MAGTAMRVGSCLLLVVLCQASQASFALEGEKFEPDQSQKVMAMSDILSRVGEHQQMAALKQKVSELSLKSRVKDEEIASLKLNRNAHRSLGESEDMNEPSERVAPMNSADSAMLQHLPVDVRAEVSDFYTHGSDEIHRSDLGESNEVGDTMFLASSSNHWKMTRASDPDAASTLSDAFPDSFGNTAVAESPLGESEHESCKSVIPDQLCLDKTASHKWIQYSVDDMCGPQLCVGKLCLGKSSFEGLKSGGLEAHCHTGEKSSVVMLDQTGRNKLMINHVTPDQDARKLAVESLKMSICQDRECADRKILLSCTCIEGCEEEHQECVDSDKAVAMQYL